MPEDASDQVVEQVTEPEPTLSAPALAKVMEVVHKPRAATVDDLLFKPARTRRLVIGVPDESAPGEVRSVELVLRAISAGEYDVLLAEHPPTKEQVEKDGAGYNPDTFAPALIAAVVSEPKLTSDQANEIWVSKTWSRGELRDLFVGCVNLCSQGLDVPFMPGV